MGLDLSASIEHKKKIKRSSVEILSSKLDNVRETKVQQVLAIDYLGAEYHVSLKRWAFRKKGTNKWIKKHKTIYGLNSVLKFGKYKGFKVKEIKSADLKYLIWLGQESEIVLSKKVTFDFYINEYLTK